MPFFIWCIAHLLKRLYDRWHNFEEVLEHRRGWSPIVPKQSKEPPEQSQVPPALGKAKNRLCLRAKWSTVSAWTKRIILGITHTPKVQKGRYNVRRIFKVLLFLLLFTGAFRFVQKHLLSLFPLLSPFFSHVLYHLSLFSSPTLLAQRQANFTQACVLFNHSLHHTNRYIILFINKLWLKDNWNSSYYEAKCNHSFVEY